MSTEKVIAEVARLTAIANEKFAPHIFIVPTVKFSSLGRCVGTAHLDRNALSFNVDLLKVAPEKLITDTVPHEMAHLVHYALRPQDFRKGSRLGHGRYWKMVARMLGLADPTRCAGWADTETCEAAGMKTTKVHKYTCVTCGNTGLAGPRVHAKVQRGKIYLFAKCRHNLTANCYTGATS